MTETPLSIDFLPGHKLLAVRSLRWCMELGPDLPTAEELAEAGLPVDLVPTVLRHVRGRWNMHAKPRPATSYMGDGHNYLTPGDAALWLRDLADDLESRGYIASPDLLALEKGLNRLPSTRGSTFRPPNVRIDPLGAA